uniref:Palmitoyltransferase n=1 Tax=Pseudo-nitzschia delicatissima TaxID=44447 RepID=A0A7S0UH91_9STRA|mmetsp:Transcript_11/g.25  ORF Transcript_11/g.25 Transcript_11/m.25 type:complete len:312 (+) Transcript_11:239-1174(+)
MSDSVRPTRTNGLSPPYTPAQLSTWIFLPTLVLEFLFCVSPLMPIAASIPVTLVFLSLAGISVTYAYWAMSTDPSDPRLVHHRKQQCQVADSGNGAVATWNTEDPTKQCWICDIQVGTKSMHCKFCNKCVDHFDHHCMWLNTCVGKANYKYFFRTMIFVNFMLLVDLVTQIALIVDIYLGNGATKERAEEWFVVGTPIPVVVIMGVFAFLNIGSLSLIGQLLAFHLKLQKEGISTYEFIVRDNRLRREKTTKLNELKVRRKTEIATAKENGDSFLVFKLEKGGLLREQCGIACCDPLSLEESENGTANGEP